MRPCTPPDREPVEAAQLPGHQGESSLEQHHRAHHILRACGNGQSHSHVHAALQEGLSGISALLGFWLFFVVLVLLYNCIKHERKEPKLHIIIR